jgi:type II secretory pathway pseudopilin PulG
MKTHDHIPQPACQRGMVLEIVLVTLVVLMLLSTALFRSVDTSTTVVGNVSFKSDAINRAQLAFDQVIAWSGNASYYMGYIDKGADLANRNYSARMLKTDAQGIPVILKDIAAFDTTYTYRPPPTALMDSDGMKVRYLVERMCTDTGALVTENCTYIADPDQGGGGLDYLKSVPKPALRVTVRVDGPRNTVSFIQATVSP